MSVRLASLVLGSVLVTTAACAPVGRQPCVTTTACPEAPPAAGARLEEEDIVRVRGVDPDGVPDAAPVEPGGGDGGPPAEIEIHIPADAAPEPDAEPAADAEGATVD